MSQPLNNTSTGIDAAAPQDHHIDINPRPPDPADMDPDEQDRVQQDQALLGESNFSDGSGPLFSMYLDMTLEEDTKMVESWKGDADGMLIFTGLFSAAVAALLAVSIPDIRPSSQDNSAFYLAHIYQQLSQSPVSIPATLNDPSAPFSAPTSAVWYNGLWLLSLVISLTCALLATLLQQWARRYLRVAYPRLSPYKRARIRAFYADGVDKLHVPWTVEALPALLHISLFLFFAGLGVFLFGIHLTLFKVVMAWIGLCVVVYGYITFLPIFHKNSPYSAPLSATASFCLTGLRYGFFRLLERYPNLNLPIFWRYRDQGARTSQSKNFFSHSMRETAEKFALQLGPDIDYRSLLWAFKSLDEDRELEQFFEGVPGLCDSKDVPNVQQDFIRQNEKPLSKALIGLMDRTLSSNLVSETVKRRRMIICTKAVEATSLLGPWWILHRVLLGDWQKFLGCIEFAHYVQNLTITHKVTAFYAKCVAAVTTASVRERDESWFQLASGQLNVSKSFLKSYLPQEDSVLLANAIFIIRQIIQTFSGSAEHHRRNLFNASSKTLESVCKFDARKTSPELQHEFCSLWNQLVEITQTNSHPHNIYMSAEALKHLRKPYLSLHAGTNTSDKPSTDDPAQLYPTCKDLKHAPSKPVAGLQLDEPPPPEAANAPPTPDIAAIPGLPPAIPPMPPGSHRYPPLPLALPPPFPMATPFNSYLGAHPPEASPPFPTPQIPSLPSRNASIATTEPDSQ